ncbi:MAG: preprotein translocase subunit YajC [Candidatus Omnitrophica bacterium CG07_land_8_20_14_0_80_42_15]|uniref:Sec translocon accessory complex subunit YajC n=1 Tax=Candidatus Aquitaenariimonas noxiae TaxID=1974741 RepID=A0A2J0L605_9BACT|nr:MAG: preprotein translocase subunit YajC [Candidatus Omnitrophica bacterium CG07_land_8_20_14_0_80_42_15]
MQQNASLLNLVPIALIFVIFYFLLIRPQQKRQVEHEKMLKLLKKNDEVITGGGIHGVIMNVKDNTVTLKIDGAVKIEIEKNSIATLKKASA